jgi:ferrous iron transport protein B
MRAVLIANGWTWETASCTALFTVAHWPCSTTTISVFRETRSVPWTLTAIALPTVFGIVICIIFHGIASIIM